MSGKRIDIFREIVIALVLSLVLVSSLSSIRAVNAQAGQVTLNSSDDTYVDSMSPNSNYGGQDYLQIENYQYTILSHFYKYEEIVWLKFNLSSVPDEAVVDMATLQLYTWGASETVNVNAFSSPDNSWTELTLTYSNMPSYNTTSMCSTLVPTSHQWYNWSVVDAVRNTLKDNSKSVTIVMQLESTLTSSNSLQIVLFPSKESAYFEYSPKLTIHWSEVVPEFPTTLTMSFFIIVTLLAVIIYKKKMRRFQGLPRSFCRTLSNTSTDYCYTLETRVHIHPKIFQNSNPMEKLIIIVRSIIL